MGLVATAAVLVVVMCATVSSAAAQPQPRRPLPANSHMITPGKRNQQLSCDNTRDNKVPCVATCPARCSVECVVLCPGCKTFCCKHTYTDEI